MKNYGHSSAPSGATYARLLVAAIALTLMTICMAGCGGPTAKPLMAGLARTEITPPVGQQMGGYGSRYRNNGAKSKGIHDPLYARVLVLKDHDTSVAIVSVDMILFLSQKVVLEARKQWGVDHVVLNATHTHSGPSPTIRGNPGWGSLLREDPPEHQDYSSLSGDPWYAETENKVIAAIGVASSNLFPARVAAGQGTLVSKYLAHNRRHVTKDGTVKMLWANPKHIPTSPLDQTVRVLRVDDMDGNCRAIMTHFSCHAVVLGAENMHISADFPGAMVAHIEKKMGPDCMGMFLQGAEGDIDPYHATLGSKAGFPIVKRAGEDLGNAALRIAANIDTSKAETPRLEASRQTITLGHRKRTDKAFDLSVTTIVINDDIAMISVPGEFFVQHQIDLAAKSPLKHTFMLGVSYDGHGIPFVIYVPTKKAAAEGGYGAGYVTFLEIGAGERIVDEAVKSIKKLAAQ